MTPEEKERAKALASIISSANDAIARECGMPPRQPTPEELEAVGTRDGRRDWTSADELHLHRGGPYKAGETLDLPKPPPYDPDKALTRHYGAQLLAQTKRHAAMLERLHPTPPKPPTLAQRVREWRRRLGRWIAGEDE